MAPSGARLPRSPTSAAGGGNGGVGAAHHVLPGGELEAGEVLGERLAGDRHAVAVDEAAVEQRLDDDGDAAGLVKVLGDIAPAGLEVGDVGGALEDFGDIVERELDARLVGHRRQMQPGIGGAAGSGDDGRGVLQCGAGHDVAGAQAFGDHAHDGAPGGVGVFVAAFIGRRHGGGVGQREADGLGDAGHGVGGELAAARSAGGAGDALQRAELVVVHLACGVPPDGLEDVLHGDVAALEFAGEDRTSVDEDARHVEAKHGHHHRREGLVAAGDADEAVIGVAADAELHGVGDGFAADERGLHAHDGPWRCRR